MALTAWLLASCVALSAAPLVPADLPLPGAATHQGSPVVAVIIDDLGYRRDDGITAIKLPGNYTYAILPHSPHALELDALAHAEHKEVLLHLPMEAVHFNQLLGPGALRASMDEAGLRHEFRTALGTVPHAIGINNHMGSLLTREYTPMRWLMTAIKDHGGLFFVDSRTTAKSVAGAAAEQESVAHLARDVFLDNIRAGTRIEAQLQELIVHAIKHGDAVGIAHPHAETLRVLRNWRPDRDGVRLIGAGELLRLRTARGPTRLLAKTAPGSECGPSAAVEVLPTFEHWPPSSPQIDRFSLIEDAIPGYRRF